jgi:hypothetical protein
MWIIVFLKKGKNNFRTNFEIDITIKQKWYKYAVVYPDDWLLCFSFSMF